jgi:hypothetical protein
MKELMAFITSRMSETSDAAAATQAEFERGLRRCMLAVERCIHVADFERMDVDVHGVVAEGLRYKRRKEKSVGEYMTLAGKIRVTRSTYRARGGHGGETIAPLEWRLGLVDGHWTMAAAEAASAFMAAVPSKEAAQLLAAAGSMQPSSSHLDRLPKRISEVWEKDRAQHEQAVREAGRLDLPDPEKVTHIAFSLDGIMLPMKDAPRTPGAGKLDTGPKGHKEVGCGTVSLYDGKGARLHTIRFGRMPETRKATLQEQLLAELETVCAQYPAATVQAVADGARDNWRIIAEIAAQLGREVHETVDYFHAAEHLAQGLQAAGASSEEVDEWKTVLRDATDGAERVLEELIVRTGATSRKAVQDELTYFLGQAERMGYAALAAAHHPIGSGVQEAACKTLVAERMKRSGMSWRPCGGQGILTLRGLAQSDRLGHSWRVLRPALVRDFDIDADTNRQPPTRQAA